MKPKIFQLRMPETLHAAARLAAFEKRESLNNYMLNAISEKVYQDKQARAALAKAEGKE